MTFSELRALFDQVGRGSALYTACILALGTGMRCDEILKLTLYHLSPDCTSLVYTVAKPSKSYDGAVLVLRRKHRTVLLDSWVAGELRQYLFRTCRLVDGVFVSPYPGQRLFAWRDTKTLNVLWYKQRLKLLSKGFDVHRLETLSTLRGNRKKPTYVCRFHKLRHIALTLRWYKNGRDLKEAQSWIKHSKSHTTDAYVHSAQQMGISPVDAATKELSELLGYDYAENRLGVTTAQTSLDRYSFF